MWICKQHGLWYQQHHSVILLRAWLCYRKELEPSRAAHRMGTPLFCWILLKCWLCSSPEKLLWLSQMYTNFPTASILTSRASSLMVAGELCNTRNTPSSSVSDAVWMISWDTIPIWDCGGPLPCHSSNPSAIWQFISCWGCSELCLWKVKDPKLRGAICQTFSPQCSWVQSWSD